MGNLKWVLLDEHGTEYIEGSTLAFDDQTVIITGMEPPHREGTSGRVSTTVGRFYAHVYGLHFEQREAS